MSRIEWALVGFLGLVLAAVLLVVLLGGASCPPGQTMVQTGVTLIPNGQGGVTIIPQEACVAS